MNWKSARKVAAGLCGLALVLTATLGAQTPAPDRMRIRPALGFEYFNRTITWDNEAYTSKFKPMLFTLDLEVEVIKHFFVNLTGGYSLSNFNGLVFRQLPFSLDYEAGNLGGILLGGGLRANFVVGGDFEMDLGAQFVTYLGSTETWLLSGLNTDGTASGKATWYRIQGGPVFWYKGFVDFSPYIRVGVDTLWGKFRMTETISTLIGVEDKDIKSKALFVVAVGTLYEPASNLGLKGEVFVLPHSKGLDYGAQAKIILSF